MSEEKTATGFTDDELRIIADGMGKQTDAESLREIVKNIEAAWLVMSDGITKAVEAMVSLLSSDGLKATSAEIEEESPTLAERLKLWEISVFASSGPESTQRRRPRRQQRTGKKIERSACLTSWTGSVLTGPSRVYWGSNNDR